uniref:Uncharacterized protein n=1 Tax=Anguilla anguilla TaxID=7936 RepID=A0A0E9Q5A8_ANGAN
MKSAMCAFHNNRIHFHLLTTYPIRFKCEYYDSANTPTCGFSPLKYPNKWDFRNAYSL